ncbi:hypothetical protein JA1_001691 [Spathaspora sp. JA1]|nr:hypothetical protein JA1_001691 [Spathaspora sp. JA1]
MASPSHDKVEDFLSSLSQLSRDRLKEDQQRQRDLQRNIDELKKSRSSSPVKSMNESTTSSYQLNIPELKFNRSNVQGSTNLNLLTPVARKNSDLPAIKPKPKPKPNVTYVPGNINVEKVSGIRSFGEMENLIKQGETLDFSSKADSMDTNISSPPPLKPTPKGHWVNTSIQKQENQPDDDDDIDKHAPPPPIRTVKPSYLASSQPPPPPIRTVKPSYLSSASLQPPAPKIATKPPTLTQVPKSPVKKDWMTSTLDNSKTTITPSSADSTPSPPKPNKSNWLASLSNSKSTTSTPQSSEVKANHPPPIAKKPTTSWISSVVNSESSKSLTQHITQDTSNLEIKISPKKSNWIDSAVRRSESSKQVTVPEKPSYLSNIPKSDKVLLKEVAVDEKPEFLTRRESLLGHAPPLVPKKKSSIVDAEFKTAKLRSASTEKKPEPETAKMSEFHSKINRLRSQSPERKPVEKTSEEKEFMARFQTVKSTVPPPVLKPKPTSVYNTPPPEFQKRFDAVVANSPRLKPQIKQKNEYAQKDAETIQTQLKNLSKPGVPSKPLSYAKKDAEVIQSQLTKLSKTEADNKPNKVESFENKLNGLLSRVNSNPPSTGPTPPPTRELRKAWTDPVTSNSSSSRREEKLTHPGKGRSKGPKRRLPKNLADSSSAKSTQITSEKQEQQQIIDFGIPKKAPPPVNKRTKPKEVGPLKPTRDFSGELFI